jgi:YidC/Oxa1 family membrane protein insertase
MEKKAIIAVVLSLLIVFLYQIFFLSNPKKNPPSQAGPAEAVTEKAPVPILREALSPPKFVSEKTVGRSLRITGDLIQMEIDLTGARIRTLALENYRKQVQPGSPPVNLVDLTGGGGYLPVNFLNEEEGTGDFAVKYTSPADEIRLAGENKVILEPEDQKGGIRVYQFHPGSYVWEVGYAGSATGNTSLSVVTESQMLKGKWGSYQEESTFTEAVALINRDVKRFPLDKLSSTQVFPEGVRWAGFDNKYFIIAFIPPPGSALRISRRQDAEGERAVIYLKMPPGENRLSVFSGPKDMDILASAGVELERAINLGWFGPIARPLLALLKWLNRGVKNYGIAIILLTVLIKILFYPFTQISMKSMKKMQLVQPKLKEIQEKYKGDKERLSREMMSLYKQEKINPASGCLPILIQIPIFIALYQALMYSIELRHAPFFAWVNDLSAPEHLLDIPILGITIPLRLLPLLMGGSMYLQQKLSPQVGDPRQAQIMMLMPLIFTFMFWGFPSGLVVYWLVNNILSIAQQFWVNRTMAGEAQKPRNLKVRKKA